MTALYRTIYSEPVREVAAFRCTTHGTVYTTKLRLHINAGEAKSNRETHMPTTIEAHRIDRLLNIESTARVPVNQPPGMDERRAVPRVRKRVIAQVIGVGASEAFRCSTDDISENGLYVQLPLSSGLRVGQRCEIVLTDDTDEGHYATVVRTEPIPQGPTPLVGAGLRFDQPLFL